VVTPDIFSRRVATAFALLVKSHSKDVIWTSSPLPSANWPVGWIVMCPDDGQPHRPIRAARVSPPEWERLAQTALSSIYHLPVSWVEQA
jgi:hypothetical protein